MLRIKRTMLCVFLILLCWSVGAQADTLCAVVTLTDGTVELTSIQLDGENWFFLPTDSALDHMMLQWPDGSMIPFPDDVSEKDGVFSAQVNGAAVNVMLSKNIRSLFLFSDDPINEGRAYIDGSDGHSTYTTASMVLVGSDGRIDHAGAIRHLRGRGNGTWRSAEKKPYQFKLENKMDLLDTGDPSERNRTWILLASAKDTSLLHNKITLDLARELGDNSASGSEHVNLYYDGEYRGLYLLCEKTEIASGRIEEQDYDRLIESWNSQLGRIDLEALSPVQGENRFGNEIHYLQNIFETDDPGVGAFFLEMENEWLTLSDPCWFRLSDGSVISCKNPEKASENMMRYISERLEEARQTLQNRGVHPETGRTLADDFDIEDFARLVLLSELSGNIDSFVHSSTFFILPAGESRFEAGPPWDYDIAYRNRSSSSDGGDVTGFRDKTGWIPLFLSCPDFIKEVKRICEADLSNAVWNILLGEKPGIYLHSIDEYAAHIAAAAHMNEKIGFQDNAFKDGTVQQLVPTPVSFEKAVEQMKLFLSERSSWLFETVAGWDPQSPDQVELWADSPYVHIDGNVRLQPEAWCNAQIVSFTYEQITEATEDEYALWRLDAIAAPRDGFTFSDPAVTINGTKVESTLMEDGTLAFSFLFEDPSYRPVDAYGEDIGLVYDYETYIRLHPEVAAECDYDPELVMEYFLYDGMYEGHQGNAFFLPSKILLNNPKLADSLGEDWWLYYTDYIAYGWMEWQLPVNARFDLKAMPIS